MTFSLRSLLIAVTAASPCLAFSSFMFREHLRSGWPFQMAVLAGGFDFIVAATPCVVAAAFWSMLRGSK
jgi:hypothetical protein